MEEKGTIANHASIFSRNGSLIATMASRMSAEQSTDGIWDKTTIEIWEQSTRHRLIQLPIYGSISFAPDGRRMAICQGDDLWIWDVMCGREVLHLHSPNDLTYWRAENAQFTPDGRGLLAANDDGTMILWEVPAIPTKSLADRDVTLAWRSLGDPDPQKAFAAIADIADDVGKGFTIVKERLRPETPLDAEQIRKLIFSLGDNRFEVRESAERKLADYGRRVWPALRDAEKRENSAEINHRLGRLLDASRPPSQSELRDLRAAYALELIGTSSARDFLRELATGDPSAPLTQQAKAALPRVEHRLATTSK
jgi:hypothetical protein